MAWHGNPLQYSCLEIPIDWGAWRATVYRVKKSHTQLKQLSMHTLFHYKGCSLVPGWGSKISDAEQHSQKIFFFKLLGINETNFQHLHEMGAKAHLEESQTRQTATAKGNDAPSVLTRTLCFRWQRHSSQSSGKNSFIYSPVLASCSSLLSSPLPKIFLCVVIFQTF